MAEDKDALAGEYVLGTLSMEERAAVARRLLSDHELRDAVKAWEARLSPLAEAAPEVEPPAGLFQAIAARLDGGAAPAASAEILTLRGRLRAWRIATVAAGALAAGLAAALILPAALLPPGGQGHYVGVVNRGGELPALIVEVDTQGGTVSVRSVSAEAPPDKSYQLWYIADGRAPLSMGLVDRAGAEIRANTSGLPNFIPASATFAVTLEPRGGSPGAPTGPVVYSGKLIPAPQ